MTTSAVRPSRRLLVTAGIAGGLTVVAGTSAAAAGSREHDDGPRADRRARERRDTAAVLRAFERQNAGGDIYEILHDDVRWTIVNGRTYRSKAEFLAEGSAPILDRLAPTLVMTIRDRTRGRSAGRPGPGGRGRRGQGRGLGWAASSR
ncbi:hypothetical protein [Micromonospora fluostatini]|uniref:hypothetical protein n=1 Tax=Micromonospora sp. JCM 30529 TaxID=3421643 RepID=UPI003D1867F2